MEHNEDIRTEESKEQRKKQEKYDSVSDETKADAAAGALGLEFVQLESVVKQNLY